MKCGQCGSENIKLSDVTGISMPWRLYKQVTITEYLELYRCQDCHNILVRSGQTQMIDAAVVRSILKRDSQVLGPGFYWLEIDDDKGLPSGGVTSAWYGLSDRPQEGNWILVSEFKLPDVGEKCALCGEGPVREKTVDSKQAVDGKKVYSSATVCEKCGGFYYIGEQIDSLAKATDHSRGEVIPVETGEDAKKDMELKQRQKLNSILLESDHNSERSIARKVRLAREEIGLTKSQLAARLGTTEYEVSKMENGERSFTEDKVDALGRALMKPYGYFFE